MSKKIQLSIAEPCHENWDNMSPVDKGKFCGSCQKQVVDFSTMSDRQVAEFFKKPSTGSVCGRFMNDQLERDIEIPRKRIPWVKYFFTIALPAFFISKASAQNIKMGKIAKPAVRDTLRIPIKNELRTFGMVMPTQFIKPVCKDTSVSPIQGEIKILKPNIANVSELIIEVKGRITGMSGTAIPFASVTVKASRNGTAADKDGYFTLKVKKPEKDLILVVTSVGYLTIEKIVTSGMLDSYIPVKLQMQEANILTGDVVVVVAGMVVRRPVKPSKIIKPIPVIPEVIKDADTKSFKVYPNPVVSGTSLNIEWKQTEEGYYTLQLLNQSGQAAHRQEIWIDAETRVHNIDMPFISAGSYFLVLTNKKTNKKFSEKIIIQ